MSFKGKRILITGGAIRVGALLSEHFASRGAVIGIHCRRSMAAAEALCSALGGETAGHRVIPADLGDPEAVQELFNFFPDVDILINNASSYICTDFKDETLEAARHEFEVNFFAPFALMQSFARQCGDDGAVLNLLDADIAKAVLPGGAYGLSKRALADLTRLAARSLGPCVRVNGLAPGPVLAPEAKPEANFTKAIDKSPLKRVATLPDLIGAAEFLLSNRSITGQILTVDAGLSLV